MDDFGFAMERAGDRLRISQRLHRDVGRRLIAAGLHLAGTMQLAGKETGLAQRISVALNEVDGALQALRAAIFDLADADNPELRASVAVVHHTRAAAAALGFTPDMHLAGPIDDIGDGTRDHLLDTLDEALRNVVVHAGAGWAAVEVAHRDGALHLSVHDDGVGPPQAATDGRGLQVMCALAQNLGGTLVFAARSPRGSSLTWRVPSDASRPGPARERTPDERPPPTGPRTVQVRTQSNKFRPTGQDDATEPPRQIAHCCST